MLINKCWTVCQWLKRMKRLSMGISHEIEVATSAFDEKTTIALLFRSSLTILLLRWRQRNLPESAIHVQSLLNLLLLLFIFSFPSASSSSWLGALASNVTTQKNSRHVTISLKDNLIENVRRKQRSQVPYTGSMNIDKWPTDVDYLQWRYYTYPASATIIMFLDVLTTKTGTRYSHEYRSHPWSFQESSQLSPLCFFFSTGFFGSWFLRDR